MNKFLRFSLLSLLMVFCGTAFAQTITFTAGTDVGTYTGGTGAGTSGEDQVTKDGVTISTTTGAFAAAQYRVFKKNTFTVKSTVGNITKIEFTSTTNATANGNVQNYGLACFTNVTAGNYEYVADAKTATWTGDANEISFSATEGQVRMTKIVVTVGEGGSDPEPVDPVDVPVVDNIAAFKALADGTEAQLTLTDAEVLFASGNDAYVRDASGCIDFFKSGLSLSTNNVLNGSVIGKFTMYKTTPEFAATSNTNNSKLTITSGTPAAKTVTVADAFNNALDLVKISGVTLVVKTEGNYTNVYAVSGDNEIMVYDKFKVLGDKVLAESFIEGQAYDIEGIVVPFNETYEIAPVNDFLGDNVKKEVKIEGAETFSSTTTVTITGTDPTGVIYYTTDGTDPVTNLDAAQYTGPFTLDHTATVKAAEFAEDQETLLGTAEKTFTKVELSGIAAFKALDKGTESELKLVNAKVLYVNGTRDIYVKDETGAIDFYNTGLPYTAGQVLNGTIMGKLDIYNGTPELVKGDNFNADVVATDGPAPVPMVVTLAQVNQENACQLVTVKNVTISKEGSNYYANVGNEKVQIYDKFKVANLSDNLVDKTVDVTGIVIPYNGVMQVCPTVALGEKVITKAANIAAFKALESGTVAELTLTNAEVVYSYTTLNGNNSTYVRDASGAVVFYNCGLDLAANQRVNGKVTLTYQLYNGLPEATADAATNANGLTITAGEPVAAKAIAVADAASYVCDLVEIKNVAIGQREGTKNYYAVQGNDSIQLYNNFHFEAFNNNDFSAFATEEPVANVKGIVVSYLPKNGDLIYEIYPVEDGITTGIDSVVTFEKNENAPIYNLAGQRVNATYKGVVVRNGKKFILK